MRRLLVRGRWRQMYLDVPQSHVSSSSISIDLARVTNPNLLYNRLPFQRESPIYPLSRPHQSPTLLAAWCFVASLNVKTAPSLSFSTNPADPEQYTCRVLVSNTSPPCSTFHQSLGLVTSHASKHPPFKKLSAKITQNMRTGATRV